MDAADALSAFSAAFGSGDVDAIMALMTDDVVFESTGPAPDGVRHEGARRRRAGVPRRAGPREALLRQGLTAQHMTLPSPGAST